MPAKKTSEAKDQPKAGKSTSNQAQEFNNVDCRNEKVSINPGLDKASVKSGLSERQKEFVDQYIVDLNATQAAIRAGYSQKTAGAQGFALLQKAEIQDYLTKRRSDLQKRTEITQEMVLQQWWKIASADPNELIAYRRVCCRHCFGKDHEYQWIDEAEFLRAVMLTKMSAEKDKQPVLPTNEGGYGFDDTIRPHPKCPECHGEGNGEVFAQDTRYVSEGAKLLYAGVKQTKDGFEVKMRSQDEALVNIARHLGMFNDSLKLKGDPENPLVTLLGRIAGTALPLASSAPDDE